MRSDRDSYANDSGHDSDGELSKTKKKQHSAALQRLGEELTKLPASGLDTLTLDAELRRAIEEAQSLKAGGARKRQIKFIGGLLRARDAEPIREGVQALKSRSSASVRRHHQLEDWRQRLISEGDPAVSGLMEQFPEIDCQHLRQLIRSARKEIEQEKAPRAGRELYRYLRAFLGDR